MNVARNLATLGAVTTLSAGLGAFLAARQISGPQRPVLDYGFTPFEVGARAEDASFAAPDGTHLAGWWLDQPDTNQVVICCHGHRGNKSDMLGIGPGLWREGFNVFLFDFRGNGDSADGPQSLAHYEQRDLEAAIEWVLQRRPDAEINVVGFSMGAAVTLLVAACDERIRRVVVDSPFADMRGVIKSAAQGLRVPPVPLVDLVDYVTGLRYGYRFADVEPIDVIAQIPPRPLYLIHGTDDKVIPVDHAHRLAEAAGDSIRFELVDGVEHCGAYFVDRPGYIRRVADFLRQ